MVVVVIVVVRTEAVPVMDPPAEISLITTAVVVTTTAEVVVVFHTVNLLIAVEFHSMMPRILAVIALPTPHSLSCQRETVQIVSENWTF